MFGPGIPLFERSRIYRRRFLAASGVALVLFILSAVTIRVDQAPPLPPRAGHPGRLVLLPEIDERKENVSELNQEAGGPPLPEALLAVDFELDLTHEAPDIVEETKLGEDEREIPPIDEPVAGPDQGTGQDALDAAVLSITSDEIVVLKFLKPPYPADARLLGVEGQVRVQALVGEDGRVREVQADPDDRLLPSCVEAAKQAALQWRFAPLFADGSARSFWVEIPFRFHLGRVSTGT